MNEFVIWLLALLKAAATSGTFWSAVGALATVAAVAGIYLTARQLRFNAWLEAQDIWVDEKFTNARGQLFRHLDNPSLDWAELDKQDGLLACRRTDEFARLAPYFAINRYLGKRKILKVWSDPLAKLWVLLEPLVVEERNKAGWKTKWDAFETLGKAALKRVPKEQRARLQQAVQRGSSYSHFQSQAKNGA